MAVALFLVGVLLVFAFFAIVYWPGALLAAGVGCLVAALDLRPRRDPVPPE